LRKQFEHNWFGKGVRKREGRREGKEREGRRRRERRDEKTTTTAKAAALIIAANKRTRTQSPLLPFFCLFFSALPALPHLEAAKVHLKI
jgi:hypothetical protein